MACFSGPEIVNDGLVFAYDMSNSEKSWKGAPTTNLLSNPLPDGTTTGYSISGGSGTLTYDPLNEAIKWVRNTYETWGAYQNVSPIFNNNLNIASQYTISFEWKTENTSVANSVYSYNLVQGNGQSPAASANLLSNSVLQPNGWFFFKYSFTPLNTGISAFNRVILGNQGANISTFYWRKLQFENVGFATPFVNGTRSNTQSILDWTGNGSTITMESPSYNQDGTFFFNGGTERIDLTNIGGIGAFNNHFTISAWINSTDISATQNILSMNGPYFMRLNNSRVRFNVLAGSPNTWLFQNGTTVLNSNTWYFLTMVWDGTANTWTGYINDQQEFSISKTGPLHGNTSAKTFYGYVGYTPQIGEQSNFLGQIAVVNYYNKALTAMEVKQNFEALRGRFGI